MEDPNDADNKIAAIQGTWYSDYKSASSVERIEAFMKLKRPVPIPFRNLAQRE